MPRPALIQFTSPGRMLLVRPEAVLVHDLSGEEVGHRGEVDVRVRAHVHPMPALELHWAHVVPEDERADEAALHRRERAAHAEAAEVARASGDEEELGHRGCSRGVQSGAVSMRTSAVLINLWIGQRDTAS